MPTKSVQTALPSLFQDEEATGNRYGEAVSAPAAQSAYADTGDFTKNKKAKAGNFATSKGEQKFDEVSEHQKEIDALEAGRLAVIALRKQGIYLNGYFSNYDEATMTEYLLWSLGLRESERIKTEGGTKINSKGLHNQAVHAILSAYQALLTMNQSETQESEKLHEILRKSW